MGDVTQGQVNVRLIPAISIVDDQLTLAELVYDAAAEIYNRYEDDRTDDSVDVAGECGVGTAADIAGQLDDLIKRTGVDFAYWVQEDPKYEFMGDAYVHVPGVGDVNFTCDAEGNNRPDVDTIIDIVMSAATLEDAQAGVEKISGRAITDAWIKLRDGEQVN